MANWLWQIDCGELAYGKMAYSRLSKYYDTDNKNIQYNFRLKNLTTVRVVAHLENEQFWLQVFDFPIAKDFMSVNLGRNNLYFSRFELTSSEIQFLSNCTYYNQTTDFIECFRRNFSKELQGTIQCKIPGKLITWPWDLRDLIHRKDKNRECTRSCRLGRQNSGLQCRHGFASWGFLLMAKGRFSFGTQGVNWSSKINKLIFEQKSYHLPWAKTLDGLICACYGKPSNLAMGVRVRIHVHVRVRQKKILLT